MSQVFHGVFAITIFSSSSPCCFLEEVPTPAAILAQNCHFEPKLKSQSQHIDTNTVTFVTPKHIIS